MLVRQYRVAAGETLLELPAGTLEIGDDGTTEDPAVAARRELEEETGMRAGSWQFLTRFYTTPGFTSEVMYLYLATDLAPAHGDRLGPDEDERLLLERIPFEAALAAVERGEIVDAKSIVGLFWVERSQARAPVTSSVRTFEPGDEARIRAIMEASMAARRSAGPHRDPHRRVPWSASCPIPRERSSPSRTAASSGTARRTTTT